MTILSENQSTLDELDKRFKIKCSPDLSVEIQSAVELLKVEDAGTNNAKPNNAGTIYDDLSDAEEEENGLNNAGVFVNLIYP